MYCKGTCYGVNYSQGWRKFAWCGILAFETIDGEKAKLDEQGLKEGLELYISEIGKVFDFENHDAGDADALIQLALFKQIIYG